MDQGRTIRVPIHVAEKIRKLGRVYNELSVQRGREPTEQEIAERLGWGVDEVRLTVDVVPDALSLNSPVGDEDAASLGDFVEDEEASDVPGTVVQEAETARLWKAIERLPEPDRRILLRRYGLDGREPATLLEVGEELGMSRERVRQIQLLAERALKTGRYGQTHGRTRE